MTEHDRRRADRDRLRAEPPDAGVIAIRHSGTGRVVVVAVENLAGARNRFDFAVTTNLPSALPDPDLAADARARGMDGLELEVLEAVPVEPGTDAASLRGDLEVLATLWRERLGSG